jgi:hypothetical protein
VDLKVQGFMQKTISLYNSMTRLALIMLLNSLIALSYSCSSKSARKPVKPASLNEAGMSQQESFPDDIKSKAFRNSDSTWGYTIYVNGRIYIHQQVITTLYPTSGFHTEADAVKTSGLVVRKIKNHIAPETVSVKELDSLGIHITKKTK